jgi:hypothetical protein
MPRIGLGIGHGLYIPSSGGGGLNPDAQAFITATGITNPTEISAINTLVNDLQGYGLWSKMKAIYPFVGGTSTTCKYNLKDPRDLDAAFRLVFNGGWTFASTGATPNGTNGYADTKLSQSANLTNTSLHASYYSNGGGYGPANGEIGLTASNTFLLLRTGAIYFNQCDTDFSNYTTSVNGFYIGSRTSSSSRKGYFNGNLVLSSTNSPNSTSSDTYYLGALNNSGSAGYFSGVKTAFASIGDGLTDTEASNFYTSVQAFQTTLGRQV